MKKFLLFGLFMAICSVGFSQLYISEYSDSGDNAYQNEFIEIYNTGANSVDISGYVIEQTNSTQSYTIPASTSIPADGFFILSRYANKATFESAWGVTLGANVTFLNSGNTCPQINGGEKYTLKDAGGTVIDGETAVAVPGKKKRVVRLNPTNTTSDYTTGTATGDASTPGTLEAGQTLPIDLTSFTATKKNSQVALVWETASEINNDYFNIERSRDGIRFETIGKIEGAGNSTTALRYDFIDKAPMRGTNYYRLTQTDFDGQSETFDVVSIDFKGAGTATINPTQVKDIMTLSLEPMETVGRVTIFNLVGQTVYDEAIDAGSANMEINASSFANGQYFARVSNGNFVETVRFIKQ